jgi:hypothetical protein
MRIPKRKEPLEKDEMNELGFPIACVFVSVSQGQSNVAASPEGEPRTHDEAATSFRVIEVAQEYSSSLNEDCLATRKRILVPPNVQFVRSRWNGSVPRSVDTDRQNLVKVRDKRWRY